MMRMRLFCLGIGDGSDISYGFGFLIIIFIISFLLVVYLFLATGYTQAGRQAGAYIGISYLDFVGFLFLLPLHCGLGGERHHDFGA